MASPTLPLRELFEAACELSAEERAGFLDAHCPDAELRARVERMLTSDPDPAGALPRVHAAALAEALADNGLAAALPAGSRIGPFALVEVLGEGGSATVFRAERVVDGVRQTVALKLLRRGVYTADAQRQFRHERRVLAQLQHPGIARLIEGGITESGVAYIALDLVEGRAITDYVRERRLDLRRRLALFVQVCIAVDAAHRALIVHRDLKPSNVMVTGEGQVKLLDFGIAKLLDAEDETQTRLPAFTPAYAAPEQHVGGLVTTATDVYALGVLLGEIVTGERLNDGSGRTPSGQISDRHAPGVLPAAPRTTRRLLRGDLDNIVLKAIAFEPDRRYASAGRLADDIERLLDGRPVAAHPASTWYRTRKFVARHKGGVASTVAFLLAVLAALGIAVWQADVARRQAGLAREQAERADTISQFLVGVFEQAEPDANLGKPITAAQLLQQGEQELSSGAGVQSGTRLDLSVLIGHLYWDLGDYVHAEALLKQAVASASDAAIPDEVKARTLATVARIESDKRVFDVAVEHARQAIIIAQRAGRAGIDSASASRRTLAAALLGQDNSKDAEPILREALASDRETYGERSQAMIDDWTGLGAVLTELSRFDEAVAALRTAVELARAVHGPIHSNVANALQEMQGPLGYSGDYAASERVQREALDIFEKVYGSEHRETLIARGNLYWAIEHQGRYEEALQGRLATIPQLEKIASVRPDALASFYSSIGHDYFQLGRFGEAEQALHQSLANWLKLQGSNDGLDSADPMVSLAEALRWQGKYAEAETTLRKAIEIEQRHEPPSSGWLNRDRATLGDLYRQQHRYAEALREVTAAVEARHDAKPDPLLCGMLAKLSLAELDAGDPAKAEQTAARSVAMARSLFQPRQLNLGTPLFALAHASLALGRPADAEPLLREVLEVRSPPYPAGDPRVLEAKVALVNALEALDRAGEARVLRDEIEPVLAASASPYAADLRKQLAIAPKKLVVPSKAGAQ